MYSISTKYRFTRWAVACLFLIAPIAFGQIRQVSRFEVPASPLGNNFEVIPASDKGLFLLQEVITLEGQKVQLVKLDTAFQLQWSGLLPIDVGYKVSAKKVVGDNFYVLLQFKDFSKFDFVLYQIGERNGEYVKVPITSFIPFQPTEFQVSSSAALIGGYFNRVPVVIHFSFTTMKTKVLPGLFNEIGELTHIRMHDDGSFEVLISALNWQKQRTIFIKNYTPEGDLLRNVSLETEDKQHLIFGRSIKSDNNMQIIAGVYGTRSAEYSRGVFVATIDPGGYQQVRYYNFADLKNFFKYMKARREQRVKNRIERKRIKGKKIRFNYRFLVHELIPYKDHFILLGEAFYPKYIAVNSNYGGFMSPTLRPGSYLSNGRIFDGYYYTHAVVMGIDQNGKLLWDNSFEINDVKTFSLEQFVRLETDEDNVALLYLFENEIRSKFIQDNIVIEGKASAPINTFNTNTIARKDKNATGKLEYWYGDYLLAFGTQEVSSTNLRNVHRKVFYINKLTVGKN